MITVNLDAAYAARPYAQDIDTSKGSAAEVLGRDGMESGLPRLLKVLDEHNIKATFFVQGIVAQEYPESLLLIHKNGHEIGCRGWANENLGLLSSEDQRQLLKSSLEAIRNACGISPVGFRAPGGELTVKTLQIASSLGFPYSSSLSDDDTPYYINLLPDDLHKTPLHSQKPSKVMEMEKTEMPSADTLLEIPLHAALYDYPYFVFHFDPPVPGGQSRIAFGDDVLTNWQWEFDGYHQYGGCFVLQLDPQITGSQGRLYLLEEILHHIKAKGNAWFATGSEVREWMSRTRSSSDI